VKEFRE